jgi:hypothetical protein
MDIQTEKLEIIRWLASINDIELIQQINSLRENATADISTEEKTAIDKGLQSIKEGRTKSHEEVMAITRKKYPQFFQ